MLRVVFYHVGKGDLSLVLLPNGEAMLVDCYKADEAAEGMASDTDSALDRIAQRVIEHKLALAGTGRESTGHLLAEAQREKRGEQRVRIWTLAITHGDYDHILSKKRLLKKFDVQFLVDNGREYATPSEALKDYLSFREEMRRRDRYIPIKKASFNIAPKTGVEIDALCPNRNIDSDEDPNNQCLVLRLSYRNRSFLFAGDTQVDDWVNRDYGIIWRWPNKVLSDVLNVSHHGSRTFFTPPGPRAPGQAEYTKADFDVRALKQIQPTISFITCADDEEADHPHPIALEIYRDLTNPGVESEHRKSHVYLSRETRNMHIIVDDDGALYCRTSSSRCDNSGEASKSGSGYLIGRIQSANGFKNPAGIWVVRDDFRHQTDVTFTVFKKGKWSSDVDFTWRVLNNGQAEDSLHHEFYGMSGTDTKKKTTWSRPLRYRGVHLMQCHARTRDGSQWANWCCLVCFASDIRYANRWLELFPNCIDSSLIN